MTMVFGVVAVFGVGVGCCGEVGYDGDLMLMRV